MSKVHDAAERVKFALDNNKVTEDGWMVVGADLWVLVEAAAERDALAVQITAARKHLPYLNPQSWSIQEADAKKTLAVDAEEIAKSYAAHVAADVHKRDMEEVARIKRWKVCEQCGKHRASYVASEDDGDTDLCACCYGEPHDAQECAEGTGLDILMALAKAAETIPGYTSPETLRISLTSIISARADLTVRLNAALEDRAGWKRAGGALMKQKWMLQNKIRRVRDYLDSPVFAYHTLMGLLDHEPDVVTPEVFRAELRGHIRAALWREADGPHSDKKCETCDRRADLLVDVVLLFLEDPNAREL